MIKQLFTKATDTLTAAALLVALSSFVSRFLGVFRDRILAGEFGAGDRLDAYYAAFRVPDLLYNLLVLGALSAGFIPVFVKLSQGPLERVKDALGWGEGRAWEVANIVVNALALLMAGLGVLGFFAAPWLMRLTAPGFGPEKLAETVSLTRIMFLSPVLLGLSSVFGGILQSYRRFFAYSLAPIMYNLGIIVAALYGVPRWGVTALAWGVVGGAALHLLIQLPAAFLLGYRWRPILRLRDEAVRTIAALMVPRTLSLAIAQINLFTVTVIGSTLQSGSLAVFNFANNLQTFPVGIFGISFAVAAFPVFAAVAFDRGKLVESLSATIRQILFFMVPATVLLLTLRAQIIRVILGTGAFDWDATVRTIDTIGYFSLSLFAQALLPVLVRAYYARHDATTPFYTGLASVAVNLVLALYFGRRFGVPGLALAFSVATIVQFSLLWVMLRLELGALDEPRILRSSLKFTAAALAAGLAVQGAKLLVWPFVDMTRLWGVLTQGAVAGFSGILVYLAFCTLLQSEEFYQFWDGFKRRLPWHKVTPPPTDEARGI